MRPPPLEAFDHFTRVYDCVDASFEEMRKTASERLRRPGTSIRWHFVLANLVVFVSWFFDPGPRTMVALVDILRRSGVYIDGMYMFLLLFGFAGWCVLVAIIGNFVYRCKDRFPFILLIHSVFFLPILSFLSLISGGDFQSASIMYLFWSFTSLAFWLLILGLLFIISGGFPLFIYMILSSISRGKEDDLIPSYIHFVRCAAEKVKDDPKMPAPGSDEWHQIEAIARWKFDGINGRVQTFSFGIASVALFGILALVFTQDDVKRALVWLWEEWTRLLGTGSSGNGGALLPVIAVGIIILPAVIYFARTYAELRRLEALGIICALAAGGSAQQHAGRSDAAQPTVDGHNDTVATPSSPAVSGDGSSDVPALSGDLHSDTLSEPNAPAVSASGSPDADLSAGVSAPSAAPTPPDVLGDPSNSANPRC